MTTMAIESVPAVESEWDIDIDMSEPQESVPCLAGKRHSFAHIQGDSFGNKVATHWYADEHYVCEHCGTYARVDRPRRKEGHERAEVLKPTASESFHLKSHPIKLNAEPAGNDDSKDARRWDSKRIARAIDAGLKLPAFLMADYEPPKARLSRRIQGKWSKVQVNTALGNGKTHALLGDAHSSVPGLAVTILGTGRKGGYVVTHMPSGMNLGNIPMSKEAAKRLLLALGNYGISWDVPRDDLDLAECGRARSAALESIE